MHYNQIMNKRGEIYILAAIILATILYSLATTVNYIRQESMDDDFEKISKNYELESSKLINNLLLQDSPDINGSFNVFTLLFTSYSKSQNPSYGIIYTLGFRDDEGNSKIQIGNYFDKEIIILAGMDEYPLPGCFEEIPATLTFDGLNLDAGIIQEDIEFCVLNLDYRPLIKVGIEDDVGETSWYSIEIRENSPQIMIISRLEEGEQRKVFIGGEGFVTQE